MINDHRGVHQTFAVSLRLLDISLRIFALPLTSRMSFFRPRKAGGLHSRHRVRSSSTIMECVRHSRSVFNHLTCPFASLPLASPVLSIRRRGVKACLRPQGECGQLDPSPHESKQTPHKSPSSSTTSGHELHLVPFFLFFHGVLANRVELQDLTSLEGVC